MTVVTSISVASRCAYAVASLATRDTAPPTLRRPMIGERSEVATSDRIRITSGTDSAFANPLRARNRMPGGGTIPSSSTSAYGMSVTSSDTTVPSRRTGSITWAASSAWSPS